MSKFSTGLTLVDLDDFISPSQECVIPLSQETRAHESIPIVPLQKGTIQFDEGPPLHSQMENVKISLNDCLACSGCITSAESILISSQGKDELFSVLSKPDAHVVFSLSSQSLASLASNYGISPFQCRQKLETLFLGPIFNVNGTVKRVFDVSFARDLALQETAKEFEARLLKSGPFPLCVGACPGWVCYAEKSHGDYLLEYLSTVKSPQQILGTLVKRNYSDTLGISPSSIYHISLMPCFDKKLEASRDDFSFDGMREVDCVLSTSELLEIIEEKNIDFLSLPESPLPPPDDTHFTSPFGYKGTSGGYAEYTYEYIKCKYGVDTVSKQQPEFRALVNSDFQTISLDIQIDPSTPPQTLIFSFSYGMRNIQNLIRKMKMAQKTKKPSPFHFIEVMACPRGCLNGGGQIRKKNPAEQKLLTDQVFFLYSSQQTQHPSENHQAKLLMNGYFSRHPDLLHTSYHSRKESKNAFSTLKW